MGDGKSRQDIWGTNIAGKKLIGSSWLHGPHRICGSFKNPDRVSDRIGTATIVFGEAVTGTFYLVIFPFTGEVVLKKEKDRKLLNPIGNHCVKNRDKEDQDEGTAKYTSTKDLLLDYREADSMLV